MRVLSRFLTTTFGVGTKDEERRAKSEGRRAKDEGRKTREGERQERRIKTPLPQRAQRTQRKDKRN